MKLTDIVLELRAQIAASDRVKKFCMDNYGKEASFLAGINSRKPPANSDLPIIAFIPDGTEYDEAGNAVHTIGMVWAVANGDVTKDGNLITWPGYLQADDLANILIEEVEHVTQQYRITAAGYDLWDLTQLPAFAGETSLTITEW